MTSQISRAVSILDWCAENRNKIKSIWASIVVYIGGLQTVAAAENGGKEADEWQHAWDVIAAEPLVVIPGIIMTAISAWKTTDQKSDNEIARAQRRADRKEFAKNPPLTDEEVA